MNDQETSILYPDMGKPVPTGCWEFLHWRIKCDLEVVHGVAAYQKNKVFVQVLHHIRNVEARAQLMKQIADFNAKREAEDAQSNTNKK